MKGREQLSMFVKGPMNYIGGKYKLLPQILDKFPSKICMFYDIFGGGGTVSLNVKSEYVYYNDIVNYVSGMLNELAYESVDTALAKIHHVKDKYGLSMTNRDGFLKMRDDYNKGDKSWQMFYMLICHSFNYQYRFNNAHEYNSSFGINRSYYSRATEEKFIQFLNRLREIDIVFVSMDFRRVDLSEADWNDLVYLDPPYLITTGNYNDGKRGFSGWSMKDERDLLALCDTLDRQGTRFALSNVFECKGKTNTVLRDWAKWYNVHEISADYSNCNYQAKDKSKGSTVEVLITNY